MRLILLAALFGICLAQENDWQPIVPASSINYASVLKSPHRDLDSNKLKILSRRPILHSSPYFLSDNRASAMYQEAPPHDESCSVFKVSMNQELFYQYVEYEKEMPDLKEFTLCAWTKFHNHSADHPLFSYAVSDSPKAISAWISNTAEASYFSMAVHGQTFFRLNYPLKLNKWYHSCQSWNGKTGEWQIWVNAERVGRGFHNRLVGHVIKGGGLALSGQEQSLLYKQDNLEPVKQQPGFMGEITMLQLYHVALTAGKAHKDHKHHHAHHFKHDGSPIESSTEAVTEPPPPEAIPIGNGNVLIGGQIQRVPNLNIAGPQPQPQMVPAQLPSGLQFLHGQFGNRILSDQLLNSMQLQSSGLQPLQPLQPLPMLSLSSGASAPFSARQPLGGAKTTVLLSGSLLNPANVQYIDDTQAHARHGIFRRESTKRDKRDNPEKELKGETLSGKKDKRGLVALSDGSIVDEALLSPSLSSNNEEDDALFQQSLMNGLAGFVGNLPVQNEQKDKVDEREPAEAEVKAVMQVCSGCSPEPFKKALVLSWRSTGKKLYSGAHYYKGLPICKAF